MEFISPTQGRLSFEQMFRQLVGYMKSEPDQQYHLIIGTDSLLSDDTTFVTAVIVHRVGHGGRYFYRKFRNRKIESLRQRILFETSLSLEIAHLITTDLARNGLSKLPVEIHLDVGQRLVQRVERACVIEVDRKSTRLNSSHFVPSRMPSSA